MRHWIGYITFAAIINLLFVHCDENSFSQVVTIDIPDHEPQLVLSAHNYNGFHSWAHLSVSRGVLEDTEITVDDAKVELFQNDAIIDQLSYDMNSSKYLGKSISYSAGDQITIKISWNGQDFQAKQKVISKPNVISVIFDKGGALGLDGEKMDEITITINDPPGENHYQIEILALDLVYDEVSGQTIEDTNRTYVETIDPIVTTWDYAICSDNSFDQTEYKVILQKYSKGPEEKTIFARINSINKDYYLYLKAIIQYLEANDNPFAEPVVIPSNFQGGLGFFSIVNGTTVESE